jgi:hypothetical protein
MNSGQLNSGCPGNGKIKVTLLLFTPTVVVYIADYIYKQNEFELQV